jgi:rfaE bifunctional protein nucleotidyltransferase chain/domain
MKTVFPHVACLQFAIEPGAVAVNLDRFRQGLAQLAPAPDTLLVLPELWATGFAWQQLDSLASETAVVLAELERAAKERSIWIAGSLLEKRSQGKPANTLFVIGPLGLAGRYRKQHLFRFWQEDSFLQAGAEPQPVATPFGELAGLVCYDLRFPEICRSQVFAGSRMIAVSAQWPLVRLDHWQLLLQARAIENQAFVIACNGCGSMGEGVLAGHSMIIDPLGRILAEAGQEPAVISSSLQEDELDRERIRFCPAGERPWPGKDSEKVAGLEELQQQLTRIRRQGSRIVFTNGCFDLLHSGHVSYLEQARSCGDCLVVGLNSDSSVRALKGEARPINSEQQRARVLAGLGCVDFVVIFAEDTPLNLITTLLPDVLVKGADWPEEQIAGAAEVKAAGGRVERIVFEHQISTTDVITKIQQQRGEYHDSNNS